MGLDLSKLLTKDRNIALDSTIFIYALNEHENFPDAAKLLTAVKERLNTAVTSVMTLLEVAVHPYKTGSAQLVEEHRKFVSGNGKIRIIDVSQAVALKAAELRVKYHLKTPDAIHLATAIEAKCSLFFTADKDFQTKISELEVIHIESTLGV